MTTLGESFSHLQEVGRAPTAGCGPLLLDGDVAYVAAMGGSHALSAVDVADPANPRQLWTLPFKSNLTGLARSGPNLWVAESSRALDAVDVSDRSRPRYHDCLVLLGHSTGRVERVGDLLLVACGDWGLVLVDPAGPKPRLVARLPVGDVESFALDGERAFVALGSGGLKVVRVGGGRLEEDSQPLPKERFYVERVDLVGGHAFVHGSARKGNANLVVLDRADPKREVFRGATGASTPKRLVQVGRRAVGFSGYKCWAFDQPGAKARHVFSLYRTDDGDRYVEAGPKERLAVRASCCDDLADFVLRDGRIYAAQGSELVIYAYGNGSVFAARR